MTYRLGTISESRLIDVDPALVACVRRAIEVTEVDFQVFEGLRDRERQRELFFKGASRTMNSHHLADRYGIGHAVDLVPYVGGRLQWQQPLCNLIAKAMRRAAVDLDVPVTWGSCWDRELQALDGANLAREVAAYSARYYRTHGTDEHPLIDGPHYQVPLNEAIA